MISWTETKSLILQEWATLDNKIKETSNYPNYFWFVHATTTNTTILERLWEYNLKSSCFRLLPINRRHIAFKKSIIESVITSAPGVCRVECRLNSLYKLFLTSTIHLTHITCSSVYILSYQSNTPCVQTKRENN